LPGAHDAGTYGKPSRDIDRLWASAQGANIYQQLTYGIRYFDLRFEIAGYSRREHLRYSHNWSEWEHSGTISDDLKSRFRRWCVVFHGPTKFHDTSLDSILDQIRSFLNETKREIIILDIRMRAPQTGHFIYKLEGPVGLAVVDHFGKSHEQTSLVTRAVVRNAGKEYPANCTPQELLDAGKRVIVLWNGDNNDEVKANWKTVDDYLWIGE
jgi:hypothetical protein